jgi:putative two-component system response regulator
MTTFIDPIEAATGPNQTSMPSAAPIVAPAVNRTVQQHAHHDVKVMVVDDESQHVNAMRTCLTSEGFHDFVATTKSPVAIESIRQHRPDVVILDVVGFKESEIQILEGLRAESELAQIPIIVVTNHSDSDTRLKALRLGAVDFLTKPIEPIELGVRLQNVISRKRLQDSLARSADQLEHQVRVRTEEIVRSRQEAIHCLARAGEYRDDDTGHHVTRVGRFSALIATELGFPRDAVDLIEQAAQLHDVGKIGIPDSILHKPGKLEPHEFEIIQEHCSIGRRIINPLSHEESIRLKSHTSVGLQIMGSACSPVLKLAAVIASSHHEKWDGSGYPRGLAGNAIPIEGRIVAVADVFDALSSERPYKEAFPIEKCLKILNDGRGSHFDPRVSDAFFRCRDEAVRIREEYVDGSSDSVDLLGEAIRGN